MYKTLTEERLDLLIALYGECFDSKRSVFNRGSGAKFLMSIVKCETKCSQLQLIAAKLQGTENILENVTFFTVLVMVMSLSHTASRAVENIDNIFVEKNEFLGYILAVMSFLSIIRGLVTFLKANKNGCLGIKGTFLVTPFFVIGTCSRYQHYSNTSQN